MLSPRSLRRLEHVPTPVWDGPSHFRRPEGAEGPRWPASGHRGQRRCPLISRQCHADGAIWGLLDGHNDHCTWGTHATYDGTGHLVRTGPPHHAGQEGYHRRAPGKRDRVGGVQTPWPGFKGLPPCLNHPLGAHQYLRLVCAAMGEGGVGSSQTWRRSGARWIHRRPRRTPYYLDTIFLALYPSWARGLVVRILFLNLIMLKRLHLEQRYIHNSAHINERKIRIVLYS